jgi:hypothetical protein
MRGIAKMVAALKKFSAAVFKGGGEPNPHHF